MDWHLLLTFIMNRLAVSYLLIKNCKFSEWTQRTCNSHTRGMDNWSVSDLIVIQADCMHFDEVFNEFSSHARSLQKELRYYLLH